MLRSLFTSPRERRLWIWTLIALIAIYSTIGFASSLLASLRDWELLDTLFFLGALLIGAVILTRGFQIRPHGVEIVIALGIAAVYFLALVRTVSPAERTHLIEYSIVAVLLYEALIERSRQGGRVYRPALIAIVATALAGTLDECIQALLPNRFFDFRDIMFNSLAGVMAVAAVTAMDWSRRTYCRQAWMIRIETALRSWLSGVKRR